MHRERILEINKEIICFQIFFINHVVSSNIPLSDKNFARRTKFSSDLIFRRT